jgi:hypothetical protein
MKSSRFILTTLSSVGVALAGIATSQAAISVYVSAPDIEKAEDSGFTGVSISTEDFSTPAQGAFPGVGGSYTSTAIDATYTAGGGNASTVSANDQYGGNGEGKYLRIPEVSSITIALDNTTYTNGAQYFGFYFTAGDAGNQIDFYDDDTLVYSFSTASLITLLPKNSTVTAINGSVYDTDDYYGQPITNSNINEPYAYLHFIATNGDTFNKIVLSQKDTPFPTAFENDNHSIMEAAPSLPGTLVPVANAVPEPSSALLGGLSALALFRRRRNA